MIKKITKLVLVTALQLQITLYMEILLFWYQPSKVPNLAHHCSDELPLYSQAVQLKPIWVVVCISRNQVWNAKIFLCLIKIYWLTAGKLGERGQGGGEGETHYLLSSVTSENIQYQGSWTDKLICLHSTSFLIYYEQTFNEGIKKQRSTTTMHRLRTLRNSASCRQNDKFIRTTSAFTQYTHTKKGKTFSP